MGQRSCCMMVGYMRATKKMNSRNYVTQKSVICRNCQSDACEWCQVERVVNNVEIELNNEEDEYYVHSSTNGDYGPSSPWDAPGMSVSDFIE